MSYAEIISTISLLFSFLAITINAYPHIRDYGDKSDERRKNMLEIFTKTEWSNEGDIFTTPKAHYILSFKIAHGISRVYGMIKINLDEKEYYFHGVVTKNGVIKTKIMEPIGKNGVYVANAEFRYLKEVDEIVYTFKGFIGPTEEAQSHGVLDTKQFFWRAPN